MNEISDAQEFATLSDTYNEPAGLARSVQGQYPPDMTEKAEKEVTPGQPTQYALYGAGYTATTATIPTLPSGCYDITQDNQRTFVVPTPKPTGLLLELPEMRSDDIIKMVENFWNSEKDYKEGNEFVVGGATFKAGIMLYGEPGTGKSCTIKIVSNKMVDRGGTVFYASAHPISVMNFLSDFSKVESNRKCIVILEDLDSLIFNFGESNYLEMLDSAKTIDNVLFIATTNYPEKLDPRIYNRPGRFSHVVKVGLPGPKAREAFLKAILKNHRDVAEIVEKSGGFSVDHLSALCNSVYREKKGLAQELDRLRALFKIPKCEAERKIGI